MSDERQEGTEVMEAMEAELEATRRALQEAQEELSSMERRREVDDALASAGASDMETARLLVEIRMTEEEGMDASAAAAALRAEKPWLFATASIGATRSTLSAHAEADGASSLEAAAEEAKGGDRKALLRYLRLRRSARA